MKYLLILLPLLFTGCGLENNTDETIEKTIRHLQDIKAAPGTCEILAIKKDGIELKAELRVCIL